MKLDDWPFLVSHGIASGRAQAVVWIPNTLQRTYQRIFFCADHVIARRFPLRTETATLFGGGIVLNYSVGCVASCVI